MKRLRLLVLGLFGLFSITFVASATATFTDREPPSAICEKMQVPATFEISIQPKVIYLKPCAAKIDSADIARAREEYFKSGQVLARSRVSVRCGNSQTSPRYLM